MKPESKIENTFVKKVRKSKYPAVALKLILFSKKGFPDRTILGNGKVFFIEFKTGNEKLRPLQRKWKRILTKLGFKYYVCYTAKEAFEIFKREMDSA